jgi:hypothetical protein
MLADQLVSTVAQVLATLTIDVDDDRIDVEQKEAVDRVIHERAEAGLARAQLVLCPLALADVARQAEEATATLVELPDTDLHGEDDSILAPVTGLDGDGFPGGDGLLQALDRHIVEAGIELAPMFAD